METISLKSFTYNCGGGNLAGVVVLDDLIEEEKMLKIAADIGYSETAFVKKINDDLFDVRFFTPKCEVDLCGHATIATFYYLAISGIIKSSKEKKIVYQKTKAGKLEIQIDYNEGKVDSVLMQQANPKEYGTIKGNQKDKIAKSLNVDVEKIGLEDHLVEPTIVSTGIKDILIPVKDRTVLNNIVANHDLITQISIEENVCGYHVFTIENKQIYARNFAPSVGIDEECATGTSNGALTYLLYKNNIIDNYVEVIQGESMNEKSQICCNIQKTIKGYDVRVGGKAIIINNINLSN